MKTGIVLPILFSVVAGTSITQAQPAGTFTATGTMATP
jgi:hypothetical protein